MTRPGAHTASAPPGLPMYSPGSHTAMQEQTPLPPQKPIALVLIHGIGIQDRFQQLSDFTDGILKTLRGQDAAEFEVTRRDSDPSRPDGRYIPLTVKRKSDGREFLIDVHEVFW